MKISRQVSMQIKGVAIVMMVFHHLFSYSSWWKTSFVPVFYSFLPMSCIAEIGECMKICIPIYAFITGYGLSFSFSSKPISEMYRWVVRKLFFTLLNYWVILSIIEIVILIAGKQSSISVTGIIGNLFGVGELIIPFAWYISFYIMVLLVFPMIFSFIKRMKSGLQLGTLCMFYIGICYAIYYILRRENIENEILDLIINYLIYSPFVVVGCVYGQEWCGKITISFVSQKYKKILSLTVIIISLSTKFVLHASTVLDIVIVPCFVISLAYLLNAKESMYLSRALSYLGKHSFNIWLFHCVPFIWILPGNTLIQDVIYFPRIIVLILLWTLLLQIPFSYATNWILKKVERLFT